MFRKENRLKVFEYKMQTIFESKVRMSNRLEKTAKWGTS
jgi:hypothetical protein